MERTRDWAHLSSRASDLAEAFFVQDRLDEAEEWTRIAQAHASLDDLDAQTFWRSVRAKVYAQQGEFEKADELILEAQRLSQKSDGLNRHAKATADFGEILSLAGRAQDAAAIFGEALSLYEQKGNAVAAARIRALRKGLALV